MTRKNQNIYSTDIQHTESADVVVIGGGIAGVYAALASAEEGVHTVLIEQHAFVGGMGTAGGVHTFCGEPRWVNNTWREMLTRLEQFNALEPYNPNADGRRFGIEELKFVLQEMLHERGVKLYLHAYFLDSRINDGTISSVYFVNKSGINEIQCNQVIDATGDADVVARSKYGFEKGGPTLHRISDKQGAGIKKESTRLQLPMSLYFAMVNTGKPVTPFLPASCPAWDGDDDLPMITVHQHPNMIVIKMKVIGHDATDGKSLSEAEQEGRRQLFGVVYHLQTKGYQNNVYSTYALQWVAPHMGVREGRRILPEHELKITEILAGKHYADSVAVGNYHLDYQWPDTVRRAGTGITAQCPPYQIPMRAMFPKNTKNLQVPGRSMGGEQLALTSFRVMGTCAQTGFAAGTTAAMAVLNEKEIRELSVENVRFRLQKKGVRFDLEPYKSYLRVRRKEEETEGLKRAYCSNLLTGKGAFLLDGTFISCWMRRNTHKNGTVEESVFSITRFEGEWNAPKKILQKEKYQSDGEAQSIYVLPAFPGRNTILPEMYDVQISNSRVHETGSSIIPLFTLINRRNSTNDVIDLLVSKDKGESWEEIGTLQLPGQLHTMMLDNDNHLIGVVLINGTFTLLRSNISLTAACTDSEVKNAASETIQWQKLAAFEALSVSTRKVQAYMWEIDHTFSGICLVERGGENSKSSKGNIYLYNKEKSMCISMHEMEVPVGNDQEISISSAGFQTNRCETSERTEGTAVLSNEIYPMCPLVVATNAQTDGPKGCSLYLSYDSGQTWRYTLDIGDGNTTYEILDLKTTSDGLGLTFFINETTIGFLRCSEEHIKGEDMIELTPGVRATSDYDILKPLLEGL